MIAFFQKIDISNIDIVGCLIGLIGIALAIYFFLKARKSKKPLYKLRSINLMSSELRKDENIEIKYYGKSVENLTVSKIAFWNGGKGTINKNDIPQKSLLTLKANSNIIIYNAALCAVIDESNSIQIAHQEMNNCVEIDFEYLDYNQGGVVKIVHSGNNSSDFTVDGKVKGAGAFKEAREELNEKVSFLNGFVLFFGALAVAIFSNSIIVKYLYFVVSALIFYGTLIMLFESKIPNQIKKLMND